MAGVSGFMSLTSSRVKLPGMDIVSTDAGLTSRSARFCRYLRLDHCIPSKRIAYMDDYQDEILEWHAAEQDGPEPAEDAFEL